MWRPDEWEEITFNLGFATSYKAESGELRAFSDGIEVGADAILEALFKLAKESPTGTFIIDSKEIYIYLGE